MSAPHIRSFVRGMPLSCPFVCDRPPLAVPAGTRAVRMEIGLADGFDLADDLPEQTFLIGVEPTVAGNSYKGTSAAVRVEVHGDAPLTRSLRNSLRSRSERRLDGVPL